jgi:glycosyltransferase involved in cell wall biosynthesis
MSVELETPTIGVPPQSLPSVVLVSRYFAPGAAVGGKRFTFLCREFESRGLDIQVVTMALDRDEPTDPSLPMPRNVFACRPAVRLPLRRSTILGRAINRVAGAVLAPADLDIFWIPCATRCGRLITNRGGFSFVIATLPPPSAALVAARIARSRNCPLILDYRDPWTGFVWPHKLRGRFERTVAQRLERWCVRQSAARIFITDEMRQSFEAHFPECRHDRNWVIPNGTDLVPTLGPAVRQGRDIVHAGSLYGDRSIVSLLSALDLLIGRKTMLAGTRVLVYGDISAAEKQAVTAAGLGHLLEVRGRISRDELQVRVREARALLVISGDQMAYSIPYKLYDYLAACKPILAVASPRSAAARFMREHAVGRCVDPANVTELGRALEEVLLGSERQVIDDKTISAYLWSTLAEQYLHVLRILAADRATAAPRR